MTMPTLFRHRWIRFVGALLAAQALSAAPPQPSEVDPLGRIFFTPRDRAELDRIRLGITDSEQTGDSSRTVRLDGIVQRSGKPPLIWINGTRYQGHDVAGAAIMPNTVSASTLVVGMPPPEATQMTLKVGQTLDPAGGNLREVYQRPPQELNQLLQRLSGRSNASAKATPSDANASPRSKAKKHPK